MQEWKELFVKNKLLASNDRKRFYKIEINYENQDLIKTEFDMKYPDIEDKVKSKVVLALLAHIAKVKKRNERRADIKRVSEKAAKRH